MNRYFFTFFISLFITASLNAQVEAEKINYGDSTENIIYYHEDLNLKFVINRKFNNLSISNSSLDNEIFWRANDNNNIGLGFSYKWLGLNLLANFRSLNNDEDIYGYTNSLALIGNIYTKKLGLDGYFLGSEGYYLDEPNLWYPDWQSGDQYPLNPELRTVSTGINALYIFNGEHFSLKSTIILNERQIKSAGSWLAGAYINLTGIARDSMSILPLEINEPDLQGLDITSASYASLGLMGGYGHNFIIKEYFFISILGAIGLDMQRSNIETEQVEFENFDRESGSAKAIFRFAMGYSGEKYFGALTAFSDNNGLGRSLNYGYGFVRFTFGYRIKNFKIGAKRKPD